MIKSNNKKTENKSPTFKQGNHEMIYIDVNEEGSVEGDGLERSLGGAEQKH